MHRSFSLVAIAITSWVGGGSAIAAAVFSENFDSFNIGRSWGIYDQAGQFVDTTGAGIEVQRSRTVVAAHSGNQLLEMDARKNASIAALVDLEVGATYEVSFAYRPRTNRSGDNGVSVSIGTLDGRSFSSSQFLGTADGRRNDQNAWTTVSYVFTAVSGENALHFAGSGRSNGLGGLLDSISVERTGDALATPIPGAALLFVSGIGGLAWRRWKSRRPPALG
ncbi:MAG: hypothetical protein HRU11_13005 [Parvularculaceae bacterium]|nr:hypothetical protein [Parvularculaceae bacterium]